MILLNAHNKTKLCSFDANNCLFVKKKKRKKKMWKKKVEKIKNEKIL